MYSEWKRGGVRKWEGPKAGLGQEADGDWHGEGICTLGKVVAIVYYNSQFYLGFALFFIVFFLFPLA